MHIEADALIIDLADQFRGQAGKINPQALHAVVDVGINGFHHGTAAAVIHIDGRDPTCIQVVEETAVGDAGHGTVAGCHGGAIGHLHGAATTDHLEGKKQHQPDG